MYVAIENIVPAQRKLKAVSYEASQDLRAIYNIQAEQKLTEMLAQEINAEIDREILASLRDAISSPEPAEKPDWGFKKKKRFQARSITDDWEVTKII